MVVSTLTRRARAATGSKAPFLTAQHEGICEAYGEAHLVQLEEIPAEAAEGQLDDYAEELAQIVQRKLPRSTSPRPLSSHSALHLCTSQALPTWVCTSHLRHNHNAAYQKLGILTPGAMEQDERSSMNLEANNGPNTNTESQTAVPL